MTLKEKIRDIKKTSTLESLSAYPKIKKAKDLDELWEDVIKPNLPDKEAVIKWHEVLKEYIRQDGATFSIRRFGSRTKKENSSVLRRGFLNKVYLDNKELFGAFYVDNGFPAYFYSMAKDGYAPVDCKEFKEMIDNYEIPCGYFQTGVEEQLAAYKKGSDPQISTKGYKIAHIFPAGEGYNENAGYAKIANFCKAVFPRGDRLEWQDSVLSNGIHCRPVYLRDESEAQKVKKFAIAHFIRTVHPLNYFLVPNKTNTRDKGSGVLKTNIYWYDQNGNERNEIGEYSKLIEYVVAKIKDIYKDTNIYEEFLELIYPVGNFIDSKADNVQINAEYGIGIWRKKCGCATIASQTVTSSVKSSNGSSNGKKKAAIVNRSSSKTKTYEFSEFEEYALRNGVASPSGYTSKIKAAMRELNIEDVSALNEQIEWLIAHSDKKLNEAKSTADKKAEKKYYDYRSILKKYKRYLDDCCNCSKSKGAIDSVDAD